MGFSKDPPVDDRWGLFDCDGDPDGGRYDTMSSAFAFPIEPWTAVTLAIEFAPVVEACESRIQLLLEGIERSHQEYLSSLRKLHSAMDDLPFIVGEQSSSPTWDQAIRPRRFRPDQVS